MMVGVKERMLCGKGFLTFFNLRLDIFAFT